METEPKRRKLTRNRQIKACTTCRKLKTKCTFKDGMSTCERCQAGKLNCVPFIKGADERAAEALQSIYSSGHIYLTQNKTPSSEYSGSPGLVSDSQYHQASQSQPPTSNSIAFNRQEDRINNLESKISTILSNLETLTEVVKRNSSQATKLIPQKRENSLNGVAHKFEPVRNYRELVNPEYLLNASSPVGLVRNIEDRIYGKRHDLTTNIRSLGDVVSHGFISETTGLDLLELFWTHYSPWVEGIIPEKNIWRSMRYRSSLLFSVCCMLASRYDKTISIAAVKSMYDLVRQVIGLTLLNAPYFTLESLIAFYLTSIWAPTVLTDIPIDSWSMSLQALNQCVLADQIKFSRYHANDLGTQGQIGWYRLWNALVLNHVQWTIATSRPFSVPEYYISQCMQIFQFPQLSSRDRLMAAEIYLYRRLIKLTWDTRVILPSDGLKIDLIEEWKREFLEAYTNANAFFKFKYDFAYAVIFRSYLRQESGTKDRNNSTTSDPESVVTPGMTTKGTGSLGEKVVEDGGELAVTGKNHRLSKECVVIALIYHCLTILDVFNNDPAYDPRQIDVADFDFFIVIYCGMTLCEISMLLWKKVRSKLWNGTFSCNTVEEYYERSVDKLRYCYQDDSIVITPSRVHDTLIQTLALFRKYSFNEGHVCLQFATILEELINKTNEAISSPGETTSNVSNTPGSLFPHNEININGTSLPGTTPLTHHQTVVQESAPGPSHTYPHGDNAQLYPAPAEEVRPSQVYYEEGNPISAPHRNIYPWFNHVMNEPTVPDISAMDSYESFYIADDADYFRKIFPGGLLTLDNMN